MQYWHRHRQPPVDCSYNGFAQTPDFGYDGIEVLTYDFTQFRSFGIHPPLPGPDQHKGFTCTSDEYCSYFFAIVAEIEFVL